MALLLVATAVAGLALLAVALWVARGIDWRSNDLLVDRGEGPGFGALANSPAVWVASFLALALGLTGVALLAVGDFGVAAPALETVAMAGMGLIVFLYLVGGTYVATRGRNVSPAGATLVVALLLGTLMLVAIAGNLLMGS